jgi:hypothetical protein
MSGPLSFFSAADMQTLQAPLEMVHDSFSKQITVHKTPTRAQIGVSPNYNFLYGSEQPSVEESFTPVSQSFEAVVQWGKTSDTNNQENIRETIPAGQCRIKCRIDLVNYLVGVEYLEIDGRSCTILGTPRPHGLFDTTTYSIFLRENK